MESVSCGGCQPDGVTWTIEDARVLLSSFLCLNRMGVDRMTALPDLTVAMNSLAENTVKLMRHIRRSELEQYFSSPYSVHHPSFHASGSVIK